MLTKLTAAVAAAVIAAGTIAFAPTAFHKVADLAIADDAMLALASPGAIASPDAPAKLAAAGARLQKVAGIPPAPTPQASQWTSIAQWGRQ